MKNTNTCPKCQSTDIIWVPSPRNNKYSNYIPIGVFVWQAVPVTRYVCGSCGFTEEWIEGNELIDKLRERFNK